MTKVGVISDTHLDRTTDKFKSIIQAVFSDADVIIHAGDMTGIETYEFLTNWDLRAVRGNMDDRDLQMILPEKRIEVVEGRKIGIIHGGGAPFGLEARVFNEFQGVDIIIFGHSHMPFHARRGGTIMFNPGSFRKPYNPPATVGIIEIDEEVTFRHKEVPPHG